MPGPLQGGVGMGYTGKAPEPGRKLDEASGQVVTQKPTLVNPDGSPIELPQPGPQVPLSEVIPGAEAAPASTTPLPAHLQTTPAPTAPNPLETRIAQLEEQRRQDAAAHARQLEVVQLQNQAAQATRGGPPATTQVAGVNPFQGADPDDTITVRQAQQLVDTVIAAVPALAVQSTWDVTQEEFNEVLLANPILQQTPEPQRTNFIKKFVDINRQALAPAPAAGAPQSDAPTTRVIERHVVPHSEARLTPAAGAEPGPGVDAAVHASLMYQQVSADRTLSRKQRSKARKFWMQQWQAATGQAPLSEFDSQWKQTTGSPS